MAIVAVNTAALRDLATKLRAALPAAHTRFAAGMKEAADLVVTAAKARTTYSERIPIEPEFIGETTVRVTTSGLGAIIENRGKGHVRHPVFIPMDELPGPPGSWTSKNSHPAFLTPALDAVREPARALLIETIHEAWAEVGLG